MVKKILLTTLLIIVTLVLFFLGWHYFKYLRGDRMSANPIMPEMEVDSIKITKITAKETRITSIVTLKNYLPYSFKGDSLLYVGYIEGTEVLRSTHPGDFAVRALDTTRLIMPVTLNLKKLVNTLEKFERKKSDSVVYEMNGRFNANVFGKRTFRKYISRRLPLFHLLDIKVKNTELLSLKTKGATIKVTIQFGNENDFKIEAKNLSYKFNIEDKTLVKGEKEGNIIFPAGSTTEYSFEAKVPFDDVGKTLLKLIKDGKGTAYKLESEMILLSDFKILDNCKVELESEGKLKDILALREIKD